MKPAEYWAKRSEQVVEQQFRKADDYETELRKEYARATQSIQRDIDTFYQRFAVNNEIDMAEARKLLTAGELSEFKMTLEEFTAKAKNNLDGRWTQQLNNVYFKTRVSRLEALQTQIRQQVEMLTDSQQKGVKSLLGNIYEDTYYRSLFELQRGTGFGASFAKINAEGLQKVLGTEFAGSNWSKRIWGNRGKLAQELQTKLSQAFIRGDNSQKTIKDLVERLDVSRSNAERLVQTESAFFAGRATMDGYKASGIIQEYEFLATLDSRTSQVCRGMDGKVFKLTEMEVGVNYPPLHARCRSTTVPFFDDEVDVGERIARDTDGQSYFVAGNTTYEQWHNEHVKGTATVSEPKFISDTKGSYTNWDKQNVKEFAQGVVSQAGLNLTVQSHKIPARGQCQLDPSGAVLKVKTYELESSDNRSQNYQIKTAFHELFHAKADGLVHDINLIGIKQWAHMDDVFAESFAHYMVKEIGIADEIAPSYAGHLVETLPKLKTLPAFKQANKISDFGKVAYEYRLGGELNAEWKDLIASVGSKRFDISAYSQPYLKYIKDNSTELIDKMLENMPEYKAYRTQMQSDLAGAVKSSAKSLSNNQQFVFENVLILAMNRLGVKEL